ncbi:zonadhesin [Cottoperca gobio]|uniref:Zonadhesin n=1 Tax=Cottoperca gobio TaxID=56716 RepID=A0A6J2RI83_COTGO|nr:zonadhesin-like [Cottoperca gobio]
MQMGQADWNFLEQNKTLTASKERRKEDDVVTFLESGPLGLEGEACLEFWYLAPVAANGTELRAQLKSSVGLSEIWTSPVLQRDSWRQVFVPLNIIEPETQCPKGQICGPQTGSSRGISTSGICTIHSHTDCSTFDGVLFRFMDSCTYTLAKTCSPSDTLPLFSVEVINEQNRNSSLPTVQQVIVDMGNLRVSLLKRQTHRVVVNGVWKKIPLRLGNGTINIKSNPAAVELGTSFGLSVSYDNAGAVHVTLPSTYSDKVCGLCGNFNHLRGDDFRKPDGTNAQDATALAASWQTGQTTSSCDTILVPHQCDPLKEVEYASELYCGGLLSSTGPFAGCLSLIGAESYFRACVVGMCSSHGDPAVLCDTLQAYADICQEAGIAIPILRNSTFCPLQCGNNSHFNSCADGCPEVCSSLEIVGSCGSCEERCECDSGFKLSGGKCVQAEDCGCWYNGKHYEKGAIFSDGECVQQCQCVGNNEVHCTTMQCADDEVCKVKDGAKGCFPFKPATCSVYGDPHYITFDGMAYDFQGGCSYTLTTTCGRESSVQFSVIGHNMHPPLQHFTRSKLEAVSLQVDDLYVTLNQSGEVNNKRVQLPYSSNGMYGSVLVYLKKNYILLETTFGLRMMIDEQNRLFLKVDERYKYELCGLCGTYSEHQDDDFVTPGGQNATGPFEFGDSWKVPGTNKCISHPDDPRLCDYDEENEAYNECYTLLGENFKPCHETIHPSIYLNSCVYDYCATLGDQHTLCESLKSYAAACQVAGVELPHWQTDTACVCPINCDFEKSLCGWEQLVQDSFDWTRHSGPTPSSSTGPNQDHTTGAGFYMYIEGNNVTHGDSARLWSSMCHYDGPLCLHFWYHMYGSATAMALNIYLLKDNKITKLWSKMNNQGPEWYPGYVDIKVAGAFQIIVEGIRGSDAQSDVAIDDISMNFGSCSGSFPDLVSGTKFPSTSAEVLPSHPDGHYLYIEASSVTHGDTARLISSECSDSGPKCLQFWYHMYGSADTIGPPYLSGAVATRPPKPDGNTAPSSVPVPTTAAPEPPLVNVTAQLPVTAQPPVANVTIPSVVEATTTFNKVNVTEDSDNRPPHSVCQLDCNFEKDLCQWDQLLTDVFDWTRHSGSTPTMMTGPSSDHTTRDGNYLYIEANSASHGDTARLISSECSDSGPKCLQFWYHMYGSADTMGLHVYLLQDRLADAVWWKRNDQGNVWQLAQVDITTTGAFQVIFEGRRGSNDQSDVAIDDVSLNRGHCTDHNLQPKLSHKQQSNHIHLPQLNHSHKQQSNHNHQPQLNHSHKQLSNHNHQPKINHSHKQQSNHIHLPQLNHSHKQQSNHNHQPQLNHSHKQLSNHNHQPQINHSHKQQSNHIHLPQLNHSHKQQLNHNHQPQLNHSRKQQSNHIHLPQLNHSHKQQSNHIHLPQLNHSHKQQSNHNHQPQLNHSHKQLSNHNHQPQINHSHKQQSNHIHLPQLNHSHKQQLNHNHQPQLNHSRKQQSNHIHLPQLNHSHKQQLNHNHQPQLNHSHKQQSNHIHLPQLNHSHKQQSNHNHQPQLNHSHKQLSNHNHQPQINHSHKQQSNHIHLPQLNHSHKQQLNHNHQPQLNHSPQPQPQTTVKPHPPTTAQPQPQTTVKPQPPTTAQPQPQTTVKPQPPTTAQPQPQTTVKPQPPTTVKPQPPTTAQPQSQTTVKPHPPTTAQPQPQTTVKPQPQTTVKPQPPTTAQPQPQTTVKPQPPTTAQPQPQTTVKPQPPTTDQPQPQTTVKPHPPTTAQPQPQTTVKPQPPTTAQPQPQTTVKPHPPTTAQPQPQTTVKPQPPTTAQPQPQTTVKPQPPTTAQPQPQTTVKPQPPTTVQPQPQTTVKPQPPTTAQPQPQTTVKPHPPTTVKPQTTTATSEPTTTLRPQPTTTAGPQPTTTIKPHSTTGRPQTTTTSRSTTTGRPKPPITPVPTPSCAENSHHTTCVPTCSPTCTHLNGPPRCSNDEGCVQGCVCDEGFVRKGRVCVPIQQCGCVDRNGTKHHFDEVWYSNHCGQKCECEEDDGVGKIDCDDEEECDGNAVCLQNEEGDYYCQPTGFSECTIRGDPEYRTFDKMKHDFEGDHSYVLVRTNNLPDNLPQVYIEGINTVEDEDDSQHHDDSSSEEDQSRRVRDEDDDDDEEDDDDSNHNDESSEEHKEHYRLRELKIRVYDHIVVFKKNRRLVVDGRRTNIPATPTAGLHIWEHSSRIYLKTDFGLSVSFDGHSKAEIILPRIYKRKLGGLCGNFDGHKQNDWTKPDGTRARSVQEFGESWRV